MKKIFSLFVLLAVLFEMTILAHAIPVLDQIFDPGTPPSWQAGIGSPGSPFELDTAQTFTVGLSGTLTQVDVLVKIETFYGSSATLDWDIRPTSGGAPLESAGSALISGTINTGLPLTSYQFVTLDLLPAGISVTTGDQLAIVLSTSFGSMGWGGSSGDYYADGAAFQRPDFVTWNTFQEQEGFDLGFKTFVDSTPIPEPTTMLLLGSGLIGLFGFRRRFIKRS